MQLGVLEVSFTEMLAGVGVGATGSIFNALLSPLTRETQLGMNKAFPNQYAQSMDVIEAYYRKIIDKDTYYKGMRDNAFPKGLADDYLKISTQFLQPADYISLWRRGFITEDKCNDFLQKLKYTDDDIENIKNITTFYPTAQDLVTWGVRQIYQPTLRTALGQDMQYPTQITAAAKEIGIPEDMMKNYWAAHWAMPSPNTMFTMYAYGLLDNFELPTGTGYNITAEKGTRAYGEGVLKQLLFVADFLPGIINQIVDSMYQPLTRIDIRSMYEEGVLTKDEVYDNYLKLGYNDTNATYLTNLAIARATPSEKTLSKSMILSLYDRQEYTRTDAVPLLEALGYSETEAGYILDLEDWKNYDSYVKLKIDTIKSQYVKGILSDVDLTEQLGNLNLPAFRIDYETEMIKDAKSSSVKTLTLAEYVSYYKKGTMSQSEFIQAIDSLNYNDFDRKMILKDNGIDVSV